MKKLIGFAASLFLFISFISLVVIRPEMLNQQRMQDEMQSDTIGSLVVGKVTVEYNKSVYPETPPTFKSGDLEDILNKDGIRSASWVERDFDGREYLCRKNNEYPYDFTRQEIHHGHTY